MATCITTINNILAIEGGFATIPVLVKDVPLNLNFNNVDKQLFVIELDRQQRATFNLNMTQTPSLPVSVTLTFFRYDVITNTVASFGSVGVPSLVFSFGIDLQLATYIVCISTTNVATFGGTLVGQFQAFAPIAKLVNTQTHGEAFSVVLTRVVNVTTECSIPLAYSIVEGTLPPGLTFSSVNGMIDGLLPELDCMEDTIEQSPSVNWFYESVDGSYVPWGKRWKFKVKVVPFGFADKTIEDWFCIDIYNDWSKDRDNFLENLPMNSTFVKVSRVVEEELMPLTMCPPCEVAPTITTTPFETANQSDCIVIKYAQEQYNFSERAIVDWFIKYMDRTEDLIGEELKVITHMIESKTFNLYLRFKKWLPRLDTDYDLDNYEFTSMFEKNSVTICYKKINKLDRELDLTKRFFKNKNIVNNSLPYETHLRIDTKMEVVLT